MAPGIKGRNSDNKVNLSNFLKFLVSHISKIPGAGNLKLAGLLDLYVNYLTVKFQFPTFKGEFLRIFFVRAL